MGANRFDELVETLPLPVTVKSVCANEFGDVTISLSDGMMIEIFVLNSCEESWRFFESGKESPHLVVGGQGIEE